MGYGCYHDCESPFADCGAVTGFLSSWLGTAPSDVLLSQLCRPLRCDNFWPSRSRFSVSLSQRWQRSVFLHDIPIENVARACL